MGNRLLGDLIKRGNKVGREFWYYSVEECERKKVHILRWKQRDISGVLRLKMCKEDKGKYVRNSVKKRWKREEMSH